MTVMSFLSSRAFRVALLAGVGLTVTGLLYKYYTRKCSAVQDITGSAGDAGDQNWSAKLKLKMLLRRENVYCSDIDYVEEMIDNHIQGGPDKLQIIADFDATMTPMTYRGKSVPSCHELIETFPRLPDWYREKAAKIKDYYMAIEFDPHLTKEEKLPFMVEWWSKARELLISCSVVRSDIEAAIKSSNLYLREGSSKLLGKLYESDIPLLVFSAGIGDVIEQLFRQRYKLYDNIHIISNWMEFNHEGMLVGFKGETIHVFNKNTHALSNASYFDSLRHRHNVILLGDSLGDLDIIEGLSTEDRTLKIGYLNHHVEANLPKYKDGYDIVLAEEDSIELLQLLIENISNSS